MNGYKGWGYCENAIVKRFQVFKNGASCQTIIHSIYHLNASFCQLPLLISLKLSKIIKNIVVIGTKQYRASFLFICVQKWYHSSINRPLCTRMQRFIFHIPKPTLASLYKPYFFSKEKKWFWFLLIFVAFRFWKRS